VIDRYTISPNADELALILGREVPNDYTPQYNAAPSKLLPVVTSQEKDKLNFFHWGLMTSWSNNKAMSSKFFNLNVESIFTKISYKKKLKSNRCIIPMDGFYLWKMVAKKKMVPYYFAFSDKRVFYVAGIWEETDEQNAFTIILKNSNDQISSYQDDMPLILDPANTTKWLSSESDIELEAILHEDMNPENFIYHTVSPRIRDIEFNDVSLTKAAPASDQHGNYTLFS